MKNEYGGCLYFESPRISPDGYYCQYNDHRIDVDSGRSALQYIVENYGFGRIWLPVYNCPLVEKRISEVSNIDIIWYNLSSEFLPKIDSHLFKKGDCLLWVNYCGVMRQETIEKVIDLQNATPVKIIIDNIPAYFSKPNMEVINIYSCRKFIGVPDGGHIIGNAISPVQLDTYYTAENYEYLMNAIETGSNSAYSGYNESEKRFKEAHTAYGMPLLTKRILEGIDYTSIIEKRKKNFLVLHEKLKNSNRMVLDISTNTPSVYPYLCSNSRLRERLLNNRIFISRFWKHVLTNELSNDFEKDFAEYLIPLPIDQRYDKEDMEYIATMVKELES